MAALAYGQTFNIPKGKNAVWRNRELFAQVFNYQIPQFQRFGLSVPAEGRLKNLKTPYYVALHATSRDSKLWPVENWLDTLTKLHNDSGYSIYLPWGNNIEKQRAQVIAAELPFAVVCDKMNLLQAASLLEQSVGVIGVDTGLLHLANALDKPVVGIYTDTDPIKTGVQVSDWAKNLGGMGQIPLSEEVYQVFTDCVVAKKFDLEHKSKSTSIETD